MKRTLLFIACVLASVTTLAQEGLNDYIPFVEKGKTWSVVGSNFGESYHFEWYTMNEEVVKAGKTYLKMYRHEDLSDAVYDAGLLREENRKVYFFDADLQKEFLMFDYSLKAGDTYDTYSQDEQKTVECKVLSVDDFTDGPDVVSCDYHQAADSLETQHRYLRKWTVCRTDDVALQKVWIEGVGSVEGPLANLYDARPVSSERHLAYMEYGDNGYLPFSFCDGYGLIHGCNLPTGASYQSEDNRHQLTYELRGTRLYVYGRAYTQCGPNNYAYFTEEPTDDPLVRKLHFTIQEVQPLADCMALHATDFYVPGFDPNMSYIVVDNQGAEHPVVNTTPQMAYRPFVEDGKVWKVGAINSGNPVQWIEYYYFDGDTIIDGKGCKQMMRQRYVSPDYPDYDAVSQLSSMYEGAWYEEDKQVYRYDASARQFQLMYDFSLEAFDTLQIDEQRFMIGPRLTGGLKGFKGVYRELFNHMAWKTTWLEGVGGIDGPTTNVYHYTSAWFLMSCVVGDEVIYINDDYEDGATPAGARKNRFDFTHTVKTKPQAPMRRAAEQPLYGEYNDLLLSVNLVPLDEAYLVRITDETGKAVYERAIDAGSIVGLSIAISDYAAGLYTVTVENSNELFTGEFETQTSDIDGIRLLRTGEGAIYNLQGQRISAVRKGLNIVNGKKLYVK